MFRLIEIDINKKIIKFDDNVYEQFKYYRVYRGWNEIN